MSAPAAEIGALLEAIAKARWFARAGRKPSATETRAGRAWARALGAGQARLAWIASWREALDIARDPAWPRAAWRAEERERKALLKRAAKRLGRRRVLALLTEAALLPHDAAARAARFPDPGFAAAAAGAASQACYLGALALLAGAGRDHAFSAKLGLFLRGRWPLGILGGRAYIF